VESVILNNVSKSYQMDAVKVAALADVNIEIIPDRFTVIAGASGSGKSTLLNVVGCIDPPDKGEVWIAGTRVYDLSDDAISDFRARHVGYIFQNFNLLPVLTAYENIEYPLILEGLPGGERKKRVYPLLEAVGLAQKAKNLPGQLSGGERQRVAIARALATTPALVLADEPTANLDSKTGATIIGLMRQMQKDHHVSFLISSHDPRVLEEADDSIFISDGRIVKINRMSN
jgi:putative ABC transport system ATP-binding protein